MIDWVVFEQDLRINQEILHINKTIRSGTYNNRKSLNRLRKYKAYDHAPHKTGIMQAIHASYFLYVRHGL